MRRPAGKKSYSSLVRLCTIFFFLFASFQANAQSFSPTNLYSGWGGGTAGPFSTVPSVPGLTFSQITRGAGVGAQSATDGINADGWQEGTTSSTALAANNYFQFSITANASSSFTVSGINLGYRRSGTGPINIQMYYSVNGGPFNLFGTTYTTTTANTANTFHSAAFTPAVAISVPAGQDIVIRITAWGGATITAGGTMRILNNTAINGTVSGVNTLSTGTVTGSPFCVSSASGATIGVNYNAGGTYAGGNVFTAQLSDATGSFASPVTIGTLPGNASSGSISATIPAGTTLGTAYRIRVVSSMPVVTGSDNGADLSVLQGVSFSYSATDLTCNGSGNGSITSTVNEGISPYTYLWSNSSTNSSLTGIAAGSYSLTVTANNGCVSNGSFVVVTEPAALAAGISATDAQCNGDANGNATLTVSGGTSPYTFAWSNSASSQNLSNIAAGTYSVSITDNNGCIGTSSVVITEPAAITVSAATVDAGCNGSSDGTVTLTVNGGTSPYSFAWSNSATSQNLSSLAAGTYSVTITDNHGCLQTTTATVTEPAALTATANTIDAGCNGGADGSVTLTVNGGTFPYSFAWSNSATSQNLSNVAAGTYSVTITDNHGCLQTATATITEPSGMTVSASAVDAGCNGGTDGNVTLTVNGGTSPYSFAWSNSATSQNLSNVVAGTYSVTITDNNGCLQTTTATVTEPAMINASATSTDVNCNGGTNGAVNLTVNGGTSPYSFAWSNSATSQNLSNVAAGTYSVTITDNHGCLQTATATVTQPSVINASAAATDAGCNGATDGTVTLTVNGGTSPYTFAWSNSATSQNLSNLAAGTYSVMVTDNNGCLQTTTVTVTEPAVINAIASVNDVNCNGGTNGMINISVSGGTSPYTFSWSNSATSQNLSNIAAGTYSVTITDDNGCLQTATVSITEPAAINSSVASTNASCGNCANGSADLTVSGGSAPYTYAWSNGNTTEDLSAVLPGTYTVIITDNNGCQSSDTILVNFTTGLTNPFSTEMISVYPNPSQGNLSIRIPDKAGVNFSFVVCDLSGKIIYNEVLGGNRTGNTATVNLPVADGVYTYSILENGQILQSGKLIIAD